MRSKKLFKPFEFKGLKFKNRGVLASMTRCRANENGIINPWMIDYYRQRAESAGLVMTECVFTNVKYNSYLGAGGMSTPEHAKSWRPLVEEVHKVGSYIGAQVYHPGRGLHPDVSGGECIGPSPIAIIGKTFVRGKMMDYVQPRELKESEILKLIDEYENSAKVAKLAGFDIFEVHGANGYLCDEFLRDSSNHRKDKWGGSFENRCRFVLEVIDRVAKHFPYNRIGIKLSPVGRFQGMKDSDPVGLMKYLLAQLNQRDLLYVQLMEAEGRHIIKEDNGADQIANLSKTFRKDFKNIIITNGFIAPEELIRRVEEGEADMASFATQFIANPDLLERLKNGWPLASFKTGIEYSPGPAGYSDFPKYDATSTTQK